MNAFLDLLRRNRNYRYTWLGQIVSEIGDHFNTISVFSLALANTGSGAVVSGVMISRAIPMVLAGPLAGVLLDRMDRKKIMLTSDLARAAVAGLLSSSTALLWVLTDWRGRVKEPQRLAVRPDEIEVHGDPTV